MEKALEAEDNHECLHQFHSDLPRNLSVIPDHMLMNKAKKVKSKESGSKSSDETGEFIDNCTKLFNLSILYHINQGVYLENNHNLYFIGTKRNNRSHDLKVTTIAIGGGNEMSRTRSKSRSRNPANEKDQNHKVLEP